MRYKLYNMFIDKFSVTYKVTEEQKKEGTDIQSDTTDKINCRL